MLTTITQIVECGEDFDFRLKAWMDACEIEVLEKQVNADWRQQFNTDYCHLKIDEGTLKPNAKFVRIWTVINGSGGMSAWAFVAKGDGENQTLGKWKAGDIFKPASYRAPARHARGNIFQTSNGSTCGITRWTGPNYL
jgi:hypothetical protein